MKIQLLASALALVTCTQLYSATVSAPSTQWTALQGDFDYLDDLQPGHPDSNIVGLGQDYGLFVTHNNIGAVSNTDGTMGFRLRLDGPGGNKNDIRYSRAAYLGVDADYDGAIDLFIGVNFSGSKQELGIYAPGSTANNSPASTSVSSSPWKAYRVDASNYSYRPVDYAIDGGTTNDLNPGKKGEPDYYLSMLVDFADIVSYLSGQGISITDTSYLRFTAATSTQGNKLNEDIAGVRGSESSESTWTELGVFTQRVTVAGLAIPEPNTSFLTLVALTLVPLRNRSRG